MTEKDLDRLKTHEHERNRLRGELVNELKEKLKSWRPCPTDDFNPLLNVRRKIRNGIQLWGLNRKVAGTLLRTGGEMSSRSAAAQAAYEMSEKERTTYYLIWHPVTGIYDFVHHSRWPTRMKDGWHYVNLFVDGVCAPRAE